MQLKNLKGLMIDLPTDREAQVQYLAETITNHGVTPDGHKADWDYIAAACTGQLSDAIASTDLISLMTASMETIIREPLEPIMVINTLFDKVLSRGMTSNILAGAIGAVDAGDVSEAGVYPEVSFNLGGAVQTAKIGKSGIQAAFTEEALRYCTWDLMAINLRAMKNAMIRLKEQKAIGFLRNLGTVHYDNLTPSASNFGCTTGRGLDMDANGSLAMEDLFRALAHMSEEGFPASILLVNPLMYFMLCQDQTLRNVFMATGNGGMFGTWSGVNGPRDPWSNGTMGGAGPTTGNKIIPGGNISGAEPTDITGRAHGMTSTFQLPSYFPGQLQVMASPFVPFDSQTMLGDIFLISAGNVGYYLEDESLTQIEWEDKGKEVHFLRLRERYTHAVKFEGQGIGVFKNVAAKRNFWDSQVTATVTDLAGEIDQSVSPL